MMMHFVNHLCYNLDIFTVAPKQNVFFNTDLIWIILTKFKKSFFTKLFIKNTTYFKSFYKIIIFLFNHSNKNGQHFRSIRRTSSILFDLFASWFYCNKAWWIDAQKFEDKCGSSHNSFRHSWNSDEHSSFAFRRGAINHSINWQAITIIV